MKTIEELSRICEDALDDEINSSFGGSYNSAVDNAVKDFENDLDNCGKLGAGTLVNFPGEAYVRTGPNQVVVRIEHGDTRTIHRTTGGRGAAPARGAVKRGMQRKVLAIQDMAA